MRLSGYGHGRTDRGGNAAKLWYQIRFTGAGGQTTTGYVLGTYVSFPTAYSHDGDFEASLNAQGFPESYKNSLRQEPQVCMKISCRENEKKTLTKVQG